MSARVARASKLRHRPLRHAHSFDVLDPRLPESDAGIYVPLRPSRISFFGDRTIGRTRDASGLDNVYTPA